MELKYFLIANVDGSTRVVKTLYGMEHITESELVVPVALGIPSGCFVGDKCMVTVTVDKPIQGAPQMVIGDDDQTRDMATYLALIQYANEPCRICGQMITENDVIPGGPGLIFVGYSDDNTSRAAHGRCWQGFLSVLRDADAKGYLQKLIDTGRGTVEDPPRV